MRGNEKAMANKERERERLNERQRRRDTRKGWSVHTDGIIYRQNEHARERSRLLTSRVFVHDLFAYSMSRQERRLGK